MPDFDPDPDPDRDPDPDPDPDAAGSECIRNSFSTSGGRLLAGGHCLAGQLVIIRSITRVHDHSLATAGTVSALPLYVEAGVGSTEQSSPQAGCRQPASGELRVERAHVWSTSGSSRGWPLVSSVASARAAALTAQPAHRASSRLQCRSMVAVLVLVVFGQKRCNSHGSRIEEI